MNNICRSKVNMPCAEGIKETKEGHILSEPRVWLMGMSTFFAASAFVSISYFSPKMSQELLKTTSYESKLLLSDLGIFNFIGRITMGWMADKPSVSPVIAFGLACIGCGLCTISYPFIKSYYVMVGAVSLYGFFSGCFSCAKPLSIVAMFGTLRVNVAMGIMLSMSGVGMFVILPSTSLLFEWLGQNYVMTMALLGFYYIIGAALSIAAYLVHINTLKNSS